MAIITAGRIASAPLPFTCPDWCVVDHSRDSLLASPGDKDVIHRSAHTWLQPDGAGGEPWELSAHLASPELGYADPLLVLDVGVPLDPYAELTVEAADQFIRDLKTFTARVQQMRDQLAAMKEQQS
jgi:hypothetical protein